MLREQIQKFCESEYDFYKREDIVKSSEDFDSNVWKLFAEQGWLSMAFSEDSGGLGFGAIELSILFEEFGKSLVIEPYLATVVLSGSLLDKSSYPHKNELIEQICSGDMHISFAYAEASNSYDYLSVNTSLDSKNVLNGTKTLVLNGGNANKIISTCTDGNELKIVIFDTNTNGVSINSFSTVDGQSCAEISFENVQLDDKNIIASGEEAIEHPVDFATSSANSELMS